MPETTLALEELAARLRRESPPRARLELGLGPSRFLLESNSAPLLRRVRTYFAPFARDWGRAAASAPATTLTVLDREPPPLPFPFQDWEREPGKALKERFADLPGGRIIHKVRTGMHFLIGETVQMAVGPCLQNSNQVVNFVVTRSTDALLSAGWLLCHAAGVARRDQGLMLVGFSGRGKSTLALHLLGRGMSYVSNDRILLRRLGTRTEMAGVPKLPRVNPGTLLHNPALGDIIGRERRAQLARLEPGELWALEEKYDVDVAASFTGVRLRPRARLHALVFLNWQRDAPSRTTLLPVQLRERGDLLEAAMKSPGPFVRRADGRYPPRFEPPDPRPYLDHLADVPSFEISGGVDFERAVALCLDFFPDPARA